MLPARGSRSVLVAICLTILTLLPAPGWSKTGYLMPTDLFGVSEVGGDTWICGANGTILHTGDGKNWEFQTSGVDENLASIFFLNAKKGFCVGYHGTVLRTTDGGNKWVKVPVGSTHFLTGIHFVSESRGFIVGEMGTLLSTDDGGTSWSRVKLNLLNTDVILNDIDFSEGKFGWIVGEFGTVLRTADGGKSWKTVDTRMGEYMLFGVNVADKDRVVITGADGLVLLSESGGSSWKKVDLGVKKQVFGARFFGAREGYVFGKNIMFKSEDGGRTFRKIDLGQSLAYGWVYRMSRGVAVGNGGLVYRLANGKWSASTLAGTVAVPGGHE